MLSHGLASNERGISVNKALTRKSEWTDLCRKRIVYGSMHTVKDVLYMQYLEK